MADHIKDMNDLHRALLKTMRTVTCYKPLFYKVETIQYELLKSFSFFSDFILVFVVVPFISRFDFSSFQLCLECSHIIDRGSLHQVCCPQKPCLHSTHSRFFLGSYMGHCIKRRMEGPCASSAFGPIRWSSRLDLPRFVLLTKRVDVEHDVQSDFDFCNEARSISTEAPGACLLNWAGVWLQLSPGEGRRLVVELLPVFQRANFNLSTIHEVLKTRKH